MNNPIWFGVTCGLSIWCLGWLVTAISQVHAINECTGKPYGWAFPAMVVGLLVSPTILAFAAGFVFGRGED